jgi:hypothetical protein
LWAALAEKEYPGGLLVGKEKCRSSAEFIELKLNELRSG